MKIHSKHVVVTGGCGFIGSHVVELLLEKGYKVYILDNLSANNEEFYYSDEYDNFKKRLNVTFKNFDIKERPPFSQEIDCILGNASCIFHLAAESRIFPCVYNPQLAINTNIAGTQRLAQYACQNGIPIIYSSTSSVYGLTEKMPISEDCPIDCLNEYATSKYCGEEFLRMYAKRGLRYTILRYFNVYGPRCPQKGQYAPIIGIFDRQMRDKSVLTIVGDGEQRRDFIHVKDVAEANVMIFENNLFDNQILNVGSGTNMSINELADLFTKNSVHIAPRPGEARNTLADISKIKSLGWEPTIDVKQYVEELKKAYKE